MTETDAALPRETGQEKSTRTCPSCGAELGVVETPYGGVSAANCTNCYPQADENARQQAAAELQRERGTNLGSQAQTGELSQPGGELSQPGDAADAGQGAFGLPNAEESA